jgi:hypothetical protein
MEYDNMKDNPKGKKLEITDIVHPHVLIYGNEKKIKQVH